MSLIDTVKALMKTEAGDTSAGQQSTGAYWCDSCDIRQLDSEVDSAEPRCPDCDEKMRFERSMRGMHCC